MTNYYQLFGKERQELLTKMAEKSAGYWNIDIAAIALALAFRAGFASTVVPSCPAGASGLGALSGALDPSGSLTPPDERGALLDGWDFAMTRS